MTEGRPRPGSFGEQARELMNRGGVGEWELFAQLERTEGRGVALSALGCLEGRSELFDPAVMGPLVRAITDDVEEQKELLLAFVEEGAGAGK